MNLPIRYHWFSDITLSIYYFFEIFPCSWHINNWVTPETISMSLTKSWYYSFVMEENFAYCIQPCKTKTKKIGSVFMLFALFGSYSRECFLLPVPKDESFFFRADNRNQIFESCLVAWALKTNSRVCIKGFKFNPPEFGRRVSNCRIFDWILLTGES